MPELDVGSGERRAALGVLDGKSQLERKALLAVADVAPGDAARDVVGPFGHLWGEQARSGGAAPRGGRGAGYGALGESPERTGSGPAGGE